MDRSVPLWAATTLTGALFAASLTIAARWRRPHALWWTLALALLFFRVALAHLPPSVIAVTFARLASPAFALLCALGALSAAGLAAPPGLGWVAAPLALWTSAATLYGAQPALAVAPAEACAALFCLYALVGRRRLTLLDAGLALLALRAAAHPFLHDRRFDPALLLALTLILWSLPALGILAALFGDALAALRAQEARADETSEGFSTGVAVTDGRGLIRHANSGLVKLLGAERASLLGTPLAPRLEAQGLGAASRALPEGAGMIWFVTPGESDDRARTAERRFLELLRADAGMRLFIDPRTGLILDGSERALSFLGIGRDSLGTADFWAFAPPGAGGALCDAVLGLAGSKSGAKLPLYIGGVPIALTASAREVELGGRLALLLSLSERTEGETAARLESSGALAVGLAHDLKNVLQTILSCSEGLARGPGEGEDRALAAIAESARKGDRLVKRILSRSGEPAGNSSTDLAPLLASLASTFAAGLEGIALETALPPGAIKVAADADEVEQAALNLLVNAKEAVEGGGRILLELRREGGSALLSVEDDGPGVPVEMRGRIFEPLVTTKARPGGLGLSMVRASARRFGGDVSCGEGIRLPGARFTISLPLASEAHAGEILLVDADDSARGELGRKLKLEGFTVHTTDDGDRAMMIMEEKGESIRTVVTDLVTRGLGGRKLLESLRERHPRAQVIVLSSIASPRAREGSLNAGAAFFFAKPGEDGELLAAIREG